MKKTLLLLILVTTQYVSGQNLRQIEYMNLYKKGVQLVANRDFEKAISTLKPLASKTYRFSETPYSYYYLGLAQQKIKKSFESRLVLRQLLDNYPEWSKLEDVYYLYADANLSDGYYEEGIKYLNKIESVDFKDDVFKLAGHHFSKLELKELKYYNRQSPNNKGIAFALVQKIFQTSTVKEDLILSDKLINSFQFGNFINQKARPQKTFQEPKKVELLESQINFGLFLPFALDQNGINKLAKTNQYIFDYYDGMILAREQLLNEKIFINLYAFEVDKREDKLTDILSSGNIQNLDLAIGPIYAETNEIATDFFSSNQIVQIHPFSNNRSLIKNNLTYLAQPSYETQSSKVIDFVETLKVVKTASIYFGSAKKDSLFAEIHRSNLENRGFKINNFCRATRAETQLTTISPGYVFIIGADAGIGNKIVSIFDQKRLNTTFIGTSNTFDKSSSLNNTRVYTINSDYFNSSSEEINEFKKVYFNKRNTFPNTYVMQGYDLMLYFGRAFSKYGKDFKLALDTNTISDNLMLSGYDFKNNQFDNQVVPIVKYGTNVVFK